MVEIQVDQRKCFDGIAIGDALLHQVPFVETDETAVQTARIDERRIVADFDADIDKPQKLHGFPEGARRLVGDMAATFRGRFIASVFCRAIHHVRKRLQGDGETLVSVFLFVRCF